MQLTTKLTTYTAVFLLTCALFLASVQPAAAFSASQTTQIASALSALRTTLEAFFAPEGAVLGASTINVSNSSELTAALNSATGGETIVLASGNYGKFSFSGKNFASNVKIISGSQNRAVFESIYFYGVSNLTLDKIVVNFTPDASTTDWDAAVTIKNSSHITVNNSTILGAKSVSAGKYLGRGIYFIKSTNIVISGNEVSKFRRGIFTSNVDNVKVTYNYVHGNRTTPLSGADVNNITVVGNHLSSSYPVNFGGSGDHGDYIHYWTESDQAHHSSRVVIENNFMEQGSGTSILGIFLESGSTWGYKDVIIKNNIIHNGHPTGIRLGNVQGGVASNNTLLASEYNDWGAPGFVIAGNTSNFTLKDNIVSKETYYASNFTGDNVAEVNTLFVQKDNKSGTNYVGNLFVNGMVHDGEVNDFQIISGTDADGVGATLTASQIAGSNNASWVPDENYANDTNTDTNSVTEENKIEADSSPVKSNEVSDVIGTESNYIPTDGSSAIDGYVLDIRGLENNNTIKEIGGNAHVQFVDSNYSIAFDGQGDYVNLGRFEQFEKSKQIAFAVEYARNKADGSAQRLVWNHMKLGLTVKGDGLIVNVANNEGGFNNGFRVDGIGLNDTHTHRITVLVDQSDEHLRVFADGLLVLEKTNIDLDFINGGGREWGWMLGTPWSLYVDGKITDFRIDDELTLKGTKTTATPVTEDNSDTTVKEDPVVEEKKTATTETPTSETTTDTRVRTTDNLNVRATPNGTKVGSQNAGSLGTTKGDANTTAGGHSWVYVDFDVSPDGYVSEQFLAKVTGATYTHDQQTILALIQTLLKQLQAIQAMYDQLYGN